MPEPDPKKPWGDDADFDAAKAWSLIEGLRADKAKLTTDLSTERQAREAAEKAAADQDPEGKIAAAEKRATDAERALSVSKVLGDYPALKDFEDLLTGSTPEELKAQAERLAALTKPAEEPKEPKKDEPKPVPGSGVEPQLVPGHGGNDSAAFDADAIATAARQ